MVIFHCYVSSPEGSWHDTCIPPNPSIATAGWGRNADVGAPGSWSWDVYVCSLKVWLHHRPGIQCRLLQTSGFHLLPLWMRSLSKGWVVEASPQRRQTDRVLMSGSRPVDGWWLHHEPMVSPGGPTLGATCCASPSFSQLLLYRCIMVHIYIYIYANIYIYIHTIDIYMHIVCNYTNADA